METTNSNTGTSSFQRTVSLHNWWLIKSETEFNGRKLAVAGFSSHGTMGGRIFFSAPIAKRYDLLNLETADGITVFIRGYINKTRSLEHGISSEVSHCFLIGFPYNWEDFSYDCGEGFVSAKFFGHSDEQHNLKVGESIENALDAKSDDAAVDPICQKNENPVPSDMELQKTENISTENSDVVEVGSNSSKISLSDGSTRLRISNILRERLVSNRSDVDCLTPSREIMDNSEKLTHLPLSPLERVKYLNKRVHHLCSSERKNMKNSVSASKDTENHNSTSVGNKSSSVKSSSESGADRLSITEEASNKTLNDDAFELLPNDLKRNGATTEHDVSKDPLTALGSDIDDGSKKSTRNDTSKAGSAGNKVNNEDDPTSLCPVRRSKRLKRTGGQL